MAQPDDAGGERGGAAPRPHAPVGVVARPPAYAWAWLQRSRPVVGELARRLTGRPADRGFVDEVAAAFADDPFVRAVVLDVVADVAFGHRVPRHRPAGVTWDRGLSWWAATLAGVTRKEFETPPAATTQAPLFGPDPRGDAAAQAPGSGSPSTTARHQPGGPRRSRPAAVQLERRRVAAVVRDLAGRAGPDGVPVAALLQLADDLESSAAD